MLAGTSGFSYAGWAPRFYPPGLRPDELLPFYASRLDSVELNSTYRARPTPAAVGRWVTSTPDSFRFVLKAQRSTAARALGGSPAESVRWLLEPLAGFGARLGAVLVRIPEEIVRTGDESDARLRDLLAAWPRSIGLVVELQHPSWHVDETYDALRSSRAILCVTELPDDAEPPIVRLTGDALYLRLRRHDYTTTELDEWAARLVPFLDAGHDAYVFFRHDEVGRGAELALEFREVVARRRDGR